jgi:predicted lysophospholipase L1 biosynthesis ABC-type transport system permease subunit
VGDRLVVSVSSQTVPVHIVEQVEFFPTLDPYDEDFLVVNLHRLQERGNLLSPGSEFLPNEMWLAAGDTQAAAAQLGETFQGLPISLRKPLDRQELLATAQVDPFIMGGWTGWLLLAFVTTSVVSAAGFVTYAVFGLERRQGSVAVLESLGMSSRQVLGAVAVEFLFLLVAGGLLGALMGSWLGSLLLPFLDITGSGEAAVPPLVVARTWGAVSLVYLGIAGVFGLLLAFVLRWFSRLALQRVLKLEEV